MRPRLTTRPSSHQAGLGSERARSRGAPLGAPLGSENLPLCGVLQFLPGPYRPSRRRPGAVRTTFFESLLVSREERAGTELLRRTLLAASLLERLLRLLLLLLLRLVRTLAHGLCWTIGTSPDEAV